MQKLEDSRVLSNRPADRWVRTLARRRRKPDLWAILVVERGDVPAVLLAQDLPARQLFEKRSLSGEPGVELDDPLVGLLGEEVRVEAPHDGSVGVGSLVEICYQGDDSTSTYLFGSIEERHDGTVDLSPNSPLGVALGGAKAGDTVSFTNPAGQEVSVDVVNVD